MTKEQHIIQRQTQAIKDIINAANAGEPYTPEELLKSFQEDYSVGYDYLQSQGIEEIC